MTKITKFDKRSCHELEVAIADALRDVGERFGVRIVSGGGTFGEAEFTARLRIKLTDQKALLDAERAIFDRHCRVFGLEPKHLGTKFVVSGESWELIGIAPTRSKFPFKCRNVATGKVMLHTDTIVERVRAVAS